MESAISECPDILNKDGTWNYDFSFGNKKLRRVSKAAAGTDIILVKLQDGKLASSSSLNFVKVSAHGYGERASIIVCNELCGFIPKCRDKVVYVIQSDDINARQYMCKKCYVKLMSVKVTHIACCGDGTYCARPKCVRTFAEYENDICCRHNRHALVYRKHVLPLELHWYPTMKFEQKVKVPNSSLVIPFNDILELSKTIFINESTPKYQILREYITSKYMPRELCVYIGIIMWNC